MKRIVVYGLILSLMLSMVMGCSKSIDAMSTEELLDLGEKYLLDMNYEQAMVCFNKVIEIDPRNERAYIGLADAYLGMGESAAAIEVLQESLIFFPDGEIGRKIEEIEREEDLAPIEEDTAQTLPEEPNDTPNAVKQAERQDVDYAQTYADFLQNEVIPLYGLADAEAVRGVYAHEENESSECLGVISAEIKDMDGDAAPELIVLAYEMFEFTNEEDYTYEKTYLCFHVYTAKHGEISEIPYEGNINWISPMAYSSPGPSESVYFLDIGEYRYIVREHGLTEYGVDYWDFDVWSVGEDRIVQQLSLYGFYRASDDIVSVQSNILPPQLQSADYFVLDPNSVILYEVGVLEENRFFSDDIDAITSVLQYFDPNVIVTKRNYDETEKLYRIEYGTDAVVTPLLKDMSNNYASLP